MISLTIFLSKKMIQNYIIQCKNCGHIVLNQLPKVCLNCKKNVGFRILPWDYLRKKGQTQ